MRGIAVSNTGAIIALSGIAQLGLLRGVFQNAIIPTAVCDELLRGQDNENLSAAMVAASIETRESTKKPDALLLRTLDLGEASVITLAIEAKADWVLMDERKGRRVAAEVYGLRVVGTAGLLVHGKRRGLVPLVGPALQSMRENGYWLHDVIVDWALREAGEG